MGPGRSTSSCRPRASGWCGRETSSASPSSTSCRRSGSSKLAQQKQEYELTPLETRLIPISYAQADELQQRAKELLSPRGSIAVDERTNVLIARDIAANLNYIEELIRSLDTQTAQVLIEARIVEATSKYQRDVGIQWGGDTTFSAATGNPTGVAFPSSVGVSGGNYDNNTPTAGLSPFTRNISTPNFAVDLPAAVGTGAGGALGVTLGSIDNTLNLAPAPLGARVERPRSHRQRPEDHGRSTTARRASTRER